MESDNFLENQVLLELTLSIQTENSLDTLLSNTLRKVLRLLNASSVGFLPNGNRDFLTKVVLPKKVLNDRAWVRSVGQITGNIEHNRREKFSVTENSGHFFYGYKIGEYGILIFCRKQPINHFFLNEFALFTNALNRAIDRLVLEKTRRKAEAEARRSKLQLQLIMSTMQDVVWAVRLEDLHPLYTSPSFESLYGVTESEWYKDISIWKKCIHPEDTHVIDEIEQEIAQGKDVKKVYRIVVNDTVKWVDNRVQVYRNELGIPEMMTGIVRDISSQMQAENAIVAERRLLETVINNLPSKIYIKDKKRRKQLVNLAELEHLEKDVKDVIGKTDKDLYSSTIAAESKQEDELILTKGISILNKEVFNLRNNGDQQWLLVSKVPLRDENSDISGILGISVDITDLKLKEEELTQKNTQLEELKEKAEAANRFKSEFLANMSHEIRTPLNAVIGFTDLLLDTDLEDIQRQYLNMVFSASNSLIDLINDILDFSKIEAGKIELFEERTNLHTLCHLIADMVKQKAHYKGLELLVDVSTDIPNYVRVDPLRLRQILINLISNAIKFTHEGEIALELKKTHEKDGKVGIQCTVRDTGIGISKQNQERVFEAFSQEDASTTRKYGGTGLGLSISNKLLSLMDSQLSLESEVGHGSTFSFPLVVNIEETEETQMPSFEHLNSILLVDDNDASRSLLNDYFSKHGISVTDAQNGVEALDKMNKTSAIDLIVLDLDMPYMDGFQITEQIRKHPKSVKRDVPILLLHSRADDSSLAEQCEQLRIEMRLSKPINLKTLQNLLSSYFGVSNDAERGKSVCKKEKRISDFPLQILVAEDVKANSFLLKVMLKNLLPHAEIHIAENGEDALEWIINNPRPDLIILDIQMPIKNGYEVASAIRLLDSTHQIPMIALTAGTIQGEHERCKQAGFDDYLTKPIVLDTLKQALLTYTDTWKLSHFEGAKKDTIAHQLNSIQDELSLSTKDLKELISISLSANREKNIPTLVLCGKSRDLVTLKKLAHEVQGFAGTFHFTEVVHSAKSFHLFAEWNEPIVSQHLKKFIDDLNAMDEIMESWLEFLKAD